MSYRKEIEIEAKDFFQQFADEIKEAISEESEFDYNEIDNLDSMFHETITDRAYSMSDATVILEKCDNREEDSGIWEGQSIERQLSAMAAYSYSNDVWFACVELYNEIKENFEESRDELELEDSEDEEKVRAILDGHFEDLTKTKPEPVEKGSIKEKELVQRWLRMNKEDAGMRGGYPLGSAYIDARCGSGHGMPRVKAYVDFDNEIRYLVPHLAGKYKSEVKAYLQTQFLSGNEVCPTCGKEITQE